MSLNLCDERWIQDERHLFWGTRKFKSFDAGNDTLKPWSVVESTPVIQRGGRRFALLRVVVHSLCAR
ncbi:hypothetical protein FXE31_17380 [Vibrio cholerae]|nr:hypothetical protein FXE31_17380 [Vibrio cholerae]